MSHSISLAPGMGKTERLFRKSQPQQPGIIHVITREAIENIEVSSLLNSCGPDCSRTHLNKSRGNVIFAVAGYDDTEDELCEIHEVRKFFQVAHSVWPHWLFSCSTATSCLMNIALCVCPRVRIIRRGGHVAVYVADDGLTGFFHSGLPAAAWLHSRAGISRQAGVKQLKSVARYLEISEV